MVTLKEQLQAISSHIDKIVYIRETEEKFRLLGSDDGVGSTSRRKVQQYLNREVSISIDFNENAILIRVD